MPTPGAARPQERNTRDAAALALSPQAVASSGNKGPRTPGENALLSATGTTADPTIRSDVDRIAAQDGRERSFTDRIMFWKEKPVGAVVVDPNRESHPPPDSRMAHARGVFHQKIVLRPGHHTRDRRQQGC